MRKKRRRFGGGDEESEEMALQITSMADIFTIILVFLLKSFSSGMANVTPTAAMTLPSVQTEQSGTIKEILTLEIGETQVLVDQKPVSDLRKFETTDEPGLTADVLKALLVVRAKEAKVARDPAAVAGEAESKLLVLADERAPYSTLKAILNSAASAGYVDLQLVVTKPE